MLFFEHGDKKMRKLLPLQGRRERHRTSEIETRMFIVLTDWNYTHLLG